MNDPGEVKIQFTFLSEKEADAWYFRTKASMPTGCMVRVPEKNERKRWVVEMRIDLAYQ